MLPRTSNEKILLGTLLAILFLAGNWYGYKWYAGKMSNLQATAADLQADQDETKAALTEIPKWQEKKAWIDKQQPPLGNEGDAQAAVLDFVGKGAKEHKLVIVDQSLNDVERTAGGTRVNVSVKVKGTMQDLVAWLSPLNKPDDFYAITHFSLKADEDNKSFDCTLQIARYFKGGSA